VIPSNFSMLTGIISPIIMFDILENNQGIDATLLMNFDDEAKNAEEILD
jgi:hypothetical protein